MAVQRKKANVYVDPEVMRAAQILAVALGRSEVEIIEGAIREYLRANGLTYISSNGEVMGQSVIPRLTEEEKRRGLDALADIERFEAELRERRGIEKFSPSWELINEARDQRTRELMNMADD